MLLEALTEEGEVWSPNYPRRNYQKQETHQHNFLKLMAVCTCTKHWSENSSAEDLQELIERLQEIQRRKVMEIKL